MARAEFPAEAAGGEDLELFIWQKLTAAMKSSKVSGKSEAREERKVVEENAVEPAIAEHAAEHNADAD